MNFEIGTVLSGDKEKIFPLIRGEQMNLRMSEMLPLYKTYH